MKKTLALLLAFTLTGCASQIYTQKGNDCLKYSMAKVHHLETGYMMTHDEVAQIDDNVLQFQWINGVGELKAEVSKRPVIVTLPLYTGNYEFLQHGIYRTRGNVYGHHALVCVGYNERKGTFEFINSWGAQWCIQGRCWINEKNLEGVKGWVR